MAGPGSFSASDTGTRLTTHIHLFLLLVTKKFKFKNHHSNFPAFLFLAFFLSAVLHLVQCDTFASILPLLKSANLSDPPHKLRVQRLVSAHIELSIWQLDKLQQLDYGAECDSLIEENSRHALTDLFAQATQAPTESLLTMIEKRQGEILSSGKLLCDSSRGLSCDEALKRCTCYTGHRHSDIFYEPVRENGACKLDEMSRCYAPSYLVSRGAAVIHCIAGAKCVGDVSGRRCVFPVMSENCHCQKPCPDGSFTNLLDELRKCIARLGEISVLSFNQTCTPLDQEERDEVVRVLESSGSERAGPIIRSIKKLLASNRRLCDPEESLVCGPESLCSCGPERDGILYVRENETCVWGKGSRCFPEDVFRNATGTGNGSCVTGTECLMEGELMPCNPDFEEPNCYCQDPAELESSGVLIIVLVLVGILSILGAAGFLIYAKIIPWPLGGSPSNV